MNIDLPSSLQSLGLDQLSPSSIRQSIESNGVLGFSSELAAIMRSAQFGLDRTAPVSSSQASVSTTAQAATATVPQSEPSTETGPRVAGGLISLPPPSSAAETAAPPRPLSSSNVSFNLVTAESSRNYAAECRTAVDAALVELGLDPSLFRMSYWEELVSYPGGSYMNRCITVETPEGNRMDFDAAATLRNPRVTAAGIQMLKSGYWNRAAATNT